MKKHLYLFILIFPMQMQAQVKLDLRQCIDSGLNRNFQIRITRNTQLISVNNLTIGNAGYLPKLDFITEYSGSTNDVRQFPANGGTVIETNGTGTRALNTGVYLNWTVFDGFNIQTNYNRLKELKQIGELNTRQIIEGFIADITAEYYNYVQQNIRLNNLKSAVRLSKERLRIVDARYQIGSLSRLDLQQAKVDFNADSSRLIRQQEVLYSSRIRLNQLMALKQVDQPIQAGDTAIVFDAFLSKEQLWEETQKSNAFLRLSEKDRQLSVLDLRTAQSKNYPYLRLNAGTGYSQNRNELSIYRQQDQLGANFGLTLGFNIFDGFNRSREQRNARIQIENKTLAFEELQLDIKSDFSNMWMAYQNNMQLTALERENLQNAVENYEIAMERYRLGNLSGIELREAQNSLLEAEERLVQAEYSTKLYEISLMQISGQITKYMN